MRCATSAPAAIRHQLPCIIYAELFRSDACCTAGFGLDTYRKDLDDRGLAIAAAQEASLRGRRQLADLTKSAQWLRSAHLALASASMNQSGVYHCHEKEHVYLLQDARDANLLSAHVPRMTLQPPICAHFHKSALPEAVKSGGAAAKGSTGGEQTTGRLSSCSELSFINLNPADFRKGASLEVAKAVGPLLKAYQEEIDRLAGRAKAGEAAFLDVYQKLYEAPDPAAALAAGLVSGAC